MKGAEFDHHAAGYTGGMENPVKSMLGESLDDFINVKVEWLKRDLVKRPIPNFTAKKVLSILDYGCGNGIFLKNLRQKGFDGALSGCDISERMIEEAKKNWVHPNPAQFKPLVNKKSPYSDNEFDVVLASGVMHHVRPENRTEVYADMIRHLKPGGRLYIFEHNPLNPLTQYVVGHTEIDKNAILLHAGEVKKFLENAGLQTISVEYLMFFPPRMKYLRRSEGLLKWLPLGAQYVCCGDREI